MSTSLRRLFQLYAGLVLFGVSVAFFVQARLGLDPWDVFHQGLAERIGIHIGTVAIAVGVAVLLLWVPLRQRPGLGTVSNVILVGLTLDLALVVLPEAGPMAARIAFFAIAILMNAVATGLYIGAGLGPGPRDGLMTGLAAAWTLDPRGAHDDRAHRAGDRLAARWLRRCGHGIVRPEHRATRPRDAP